eukprot:5227340-Pleurochrysis_carterae.AAC.2
MPLWAWLCFDAALKKLRSSMDHARGTRATDSSPTGDHTKRTGLICTNYNLPIPYNTGSS